MTLSHRKQTATPLTKQSAFLIVGASSLLLLDLVFTGSWWASSAVLMGATAAATAVWPQQLHRWFRQLSALDRRYSLLKAAMLVAVTTLVLHTLAEPAAAQFYNQTEQWLTGTVLAGAEGAATVIALAFNLLRGIFVIYLGIAIVKVINAQRDGDDWQTLARTPLIVVLAATSGDIIANFITGAGGG